MIDMEKIFEATYFLTPAECNPQKRMPMTLLINRLIEVATLHANHLGIGYEYLAPMHQTWVLSRVAVEMCRYPGVNDNYTIRTWVRSVNRLFSEREFQILDEQGSTLGWASTVWAVLDTDTRKVADISRLEWIADVVPQDMVCPIAKPSRPREPKDYRSESYRFTYCDLDVNRHVNSSRYIELLLNQWSLDFHDRYRLTRFEIAYLHEAVYDELVEVRLAPMDGQPETTIAELFNGSQPICRSILTFSPRN